MSKCNPHSQIKFALLMALGGSGVVKGGEGGRSPPPTASKTIFEKSLNPCRSVGGGGYV